LIIIEIEGNVEVSADKVKKCEKREMMSSEIMNERL